MHISILTDPKIDFVYVYLSRGGAIAERSGRFISWTMIRAIAAVHLELIKGAINAKRKTIRHDPLAVEVSRCDAFVRRWGFYRRHEKEIS